MAKNGKKRYVLQVFDTVAGEIVEERATHKRAVPETPPSDVCDWTKIYPKQHLALFKHDQTLPVVMRLYFYLMSICRQDGEFVWRPERAAKAIKASEVQCKLKFRQLRDVGYVVHNTDDPRSIYFLSVKYAHRGSSRYRNAMMESLEQEAS